MEQGYEIEPRPIGRRASRRRPLTAVAVALVLVVAAVASAKPWAAPDGRVAVVDPAPPSPSSAPRTVDPQPVAIGPAADPIWPAAEVATGLATQTAKQAEGALGSLADRAGTWGVGNAGVGPQMLRDEPWTDWAPVAVEIVEGLPVNIGTWPGTDLCAGYPVLNDRPTLVAVTTPRDVAPDRVLRGWWTDGSTVASLAGSVVQVSPPGNRGISYLERVDRAPWPPGLYEFHVVAGDRSVSLTVCLTRRI